MGLLSFLGIRSAAVAEPEAPAVLAPRTLTSDEIRARKRGGTGGVAKPGDLVPPGPRMVGLIRDAYGKPRFDKNPRSYPPEVQAAFKTMMSPSEIEEYFG